MNNITSSIANRLLVLALTAAPLLVTGCALSGGSNAARVDKKTYNGLAADLRLPASAV